MKNIIKYNLTRLIAVATALLVMVGCATDGVDDAVVSEKEGAISFSLAIRSGAESVSSSVTRTEADDTEVDDTEAEDLSVFLANSKLKIYDSNNKLVRLYQPASEMPAVIYLTEGDYYAEASVTGDGASFDDSQRSFFGESDFTISSEAQAQVDIVCMMTNSIVEVILDDTIYDSYAEPTVTIYADGYESTTSLTFTEQSSYGYFVVPEGVEVLNYEFSGRRLVSVEEENLDLVNSYTGTFAAPAAREKVTNTFKLTTIIKVSTASIMVDLTEDVYDDELIFSPQPTIDGSDFDVDDPVLFKGYDFIFNVKSINPMTSLTLTINGQSLTPLADSESVDLSAQGVSYEIVDANNGILTIKPSAFDSYTTGGTKVVNVSMNGSGSIGVEDINFVLPGVEALNDMDYWRNSGVFTGAVTNGGEEVIFEYCESGSEEWLSVAGATSDNVNYTASVTPQWNTTKNENASITAYNQVAGIRPNVTYECRLKVDGEYMERSLSTTTTFSVPSIPYGEMDSSGISCFTSDNASTLYWGSGNNSYTSSLCKHSSDYNGETAAILTGTSSLGALAAGNIFLGQFKLNGTEGTVTFGQDFNWSARPRSFQVRYSSSLGEVNIEKATIAGIGEGDKDQARIYIAIVQWDSRHSVTAGTSGNPSGVWDPATQSETSEGKIIGYAAATITEDSSSYTTVDMPFYFYDTELEPTGKYSIVVSAATSRYGDYMVGSSKSKLRIDYFRLTY